MSAAEIHPAGAPRNGGWFPLPVRGEPVDLTRHLGPPGTVVAEGPVPARSYDALRRALAPLEPHPIPWSSCLVPSLEAAQKPHHRQEDRSQGEK